MDLQWQTLILAVADHCVCKAAARPSLSSSDSKVSILSICRDLSAVLRDDTLVVFPEGSTLLSQISHCPLCSLPLGMGAQWASGYCFQSDVL